MRYASEPTDRAASSNGVRSSSTRSTTAPPEFLTVAETAAVLRCGLTFVYESIHRYLATDEPDEVPGGASAEACASPE